MPLPALIAAVCLFAGVAAAVRWLPDLAEGAIGGLAFFAVCGLLGAALALLGLHVYLIVESLHNLGEKGAIFADGLQSMLWDTGSLVGLAIAVYLLAPPAETSGERTPGIDA
jgi:hypothetical protein